MDKNIRLKKITGRVRVSRKSTMTCARGSCRVLSARSSFVAQPWARLGATRANNVQWNSTVTKDFSATSTAANVSVSGIFLHIQKLAPNFFSFFSNLIIKFLIELFVTDIDECEAIPALCEGGTCVNTIGSFRCNCPPGQERDEETNECREADECQQEGVCDNGQCVNTDNGYYCICNKGFISSQDRKHCIGIQIEKKRGFSFWIK